MATLSTWWRTVRHLKPVQVYGRARFAIVRPRVRPAPPPAARQAMREHWVSPASRRASMLGPGRFRFLNATRDLDVAGWDDPGVDRLWRYNLHYFDDLNAQGAEGRRDWHVNLIGRWVRENPVARGTGWEPYPTSLRMVNWIKWTLGGNAIEGTFLDSLAAQSRWLSKRVERHLPGNHLFSNAKALVFAGRFFDGDEASEWLDTGLAILEREIPEQILADGGQFERSPMYHALALEDVLDLCNVLRAGRDTITSRARRVLTLLESRVPAMRRWLAAMCHPDGEIGFFNDASIGVAPAPDRLDAYAAALGFGEGAEPATPLVWLEASGYVRSRVGDAVAMMDLAPLGPDYLPGHAHADTLSFELSLGRERVLVNSGTSRYGSGRERSRERGTAAHNTVMLDGRDSSEVWGGFRVGRRARPFGVRVVAEPEVTVCASHDGYVHLRGRPVHRRTWVMRPGVLTVTDELSRSFASACARLHVHPDVRASITGERRAELVTRSGRTVRVAVDSGALTCEPSVWHAEFGLDQPGSVLVAAFSAPMLRTEIRWEERA